MAPKYIAFCGLDGSGKDTQLYRLKQYLEEECGKKVYVSKVKFTMFSNYKDEIITSELLHYAMGFEFVKHYLELKEQVEDYDYVFCNRHKLCYLAHGFPYGVTDIKVVNHIFSIISEPDITFYFDIRPEVSMERVLKRKNKKRCTQETIEFQREAKKAYEYLIENGIATVERIDAECDVEEVQRCIRDIFTKKIL